jgi:hypothetical protein
MTSGQLPTELSENELIAVQVSRHGTRDCGAASELVELISGTATTITNTQLSFNIMHEHFANPQATTFASRLC